jgi:hypothetical protein
MGDSSRPHEGPKALDNSRLVTPFELRLAERGHKPKVKVSFTAQRTTTTSSGPTTADRVHIIFQDLQVREVLWKLDGGFAGKSFVGVEPQFIVNRSPPLSQKLFNVAHLSGFISPQKLVSKAAARQPVSDNFPNFLHTLHETSRTLD